MKYVLLWWKQQAYVCFGILLIIFSLLFLYQGSGQRNWKAILNPSSNENTSFQPSMPFLTFCIRETITWGSEIPHWFQKAMTSPQRRRMCRRYWVRVLGKRTRFQLSKNMHIEAIVPVEQISITTIIKKKKLLELQAVMPSNRASLPPFNGITL